MANQKDDSAVLLVVVVPMLMVLLFSSFLVLSDSAVHRPGLFLGWVWVE